MQHKEQRREDIPEASSLTNEDKTKLDEWFLGRDVYQKRITRLGENPTQEQIEETRKRLLQVYFKALGKVGYKSDGGKPWETKVGPMKHLQDKTRRQITKAVETPEREMKTAIFRRGVEKLVTEMKTSNWKEAIQEFIQEGCNLDLATEKVKLYNSLELPRLKLELEEVRENGDIAEISAKELEIAQKIQQAVISFPYKAQERLDGSPNHPSKMVETQFMNCVGSSILGGGLLDEVGIKYLHADLPEHSATVLITSDGKVYWQDFTPPNGSNFNYVEVSSDMLEGDIDFSELTHIQDSGLTVEFKNWKINNKKLRVTLFRPEIGLQCHILNNTGNALSNLGRKEEAIEAYQQAINVDPEYAYPYNGLGNALSDLGKNEEAIEAYQQAINVDPEYADPYNGLGNALSNLGRNEKAIKAYKQFIKFWNGDEYWINRAKRDIEKLQQE